MTVFEISKSFQLAYSHKDRYINLYNRRRHWKKICLKINMLTWQQQAQAVFLEAGLWKMGPQFEVIASWLRHHGRVIFVIFGGSRISQIFLSILVQNDTIWGHLKSNMMPIKPWKFGEIWQIWVYGLGPLALDMPDQTVPMYINNNTSSSSSFLACTTKTEYRYCYNNKTNITNIFNYR